jgi:hypothetical protein
MRVLAGTVVVLALIVIAGAALWLASERHYEACVSEAVARTPVVSKTGAERNPMLEGSVEKEQPVAVEERQSAVNECSQWPF